MAFQHTFRSSTQIEIQERADTSLPMELDQPLVIIGITVGGTKSAGELVQVLSAAEADTFFGVGSELAINLRWAFRAIQDSQASGIPVYGYGLADPAGTARALTFTAVGTSTAAGTAIIKINGWEISANIPSGASATDVATALTSAGNAMSRELPFTAAFLAGVMTLTATATGVWANDSTYSVVQTVPGITITPAQSVAGVGAASVTAALLALESEDARYIALGNHTSTDATAAANHTAATWPAIKKRWRWVVLAERGLVTADALAAGVSDARALVVGAVHSGAPQPQGQYAAYLAGVLASESDPNRPFDEMELPSLFLSSSPLTEAEIETYGPRGLSMLDLTVRKTRMRLVRVVTTQTEIDAVADYSQLDIATGRAQVEFARQLDLAIARNFHRVKKTARDKARLRDVTIAVALQLEERDILQDVIALKALFQVLDTVDDNTIPADTVLIKAPARVIPALRNKWALIELLGVR